MNEEKRYKDPYPEKRGKRARRALAWGTCLIMVSWGCASVYIRYQDQRDQEIAQRNREIAEERAIRRSTPDEWSGSSNTIIGTGSSNIAIGADARVHYNESLCLAPCEAEDEQGEQE